MHEERTGGIVGPRLILFDCDGTLVDSHGHIVRVMQESFRDCGQPPPSASDVRAVIGLSLAEAVRCLLGRDDGRLVERLVAGYRHRYGMMPDQSRLYDGVRETLISLLELGYWLGVVTGKSHRGLMRTLEQYHLHEMFMVWRTADICPSKPHPAMVLECMEETGVHATRTTVVGDSCFDMQMAGLSGVRGLGVSFGASDTVALLGAGASAVVHAFPDLIAHFPPCAMPSARPR